MALPLRSRHCRGSAGQGRAGSTCCSACRALPAASAAAATRPAGERQSIFSPAPVQPAAPVRPTPPPRCSRPRRHCAASGPRLPGAPTAAGREGREVEPRRLCRVCVYVCTQLRSERRAERGSCPPAESPHIQPKTEQKGFCCHHEVLSTSGPGAADGATAGWWDSLRPGLGVPHCTATAEGQRPSHPHGAPHAPPAPLTGSSGQEMGTWVTVSLSPRYPHCAV